MDSSITTKNYASDTSVSIGAHIITLLDEKVTYEQNKAKFSISYVTPNLASGEAFQKTFPKGNQSNVLNKDNLGISSITTANYIELEIPKHFFYIETIDIKYTRSYSSEGCIASCNPYTVINRHIFYKGQQFVVTNVGGKLESPKIIGVV